MKKILLCLLISLVLFTLSSYSQEVIDGQFVTSISPPTYEVTIAVNLQSGTGTAGVVSLEFTYNTADLSFPSSPVKNTDYILYGNFDTWITQNITRPTANSVRISLINPGNTVPPLVSLSTTKTNIITLYFTILNESGNSDLVWVTTNVAPQFLLPNYAIGIWHNRNDIPLPVELVSFTADAMEDKVDLNWETETEVDNYGFEVERASAVGEGERLWTKLTFVEGHGSTNSPKSYQYMDKNPWGGSKFVYRLKQIDTNGDYEYSDEVEVEILPTKYELYQNYPNPFNPTTNIKFSLPVATRVSIKIYNSLGELVTEVINKEYEAGYHKIGFEAGSYASGVYFYRLESKNYTNVKKLLIIK